MASPIDQPFVTEEITGILETAEKVFDQKHATSAHLRQAAAAYSLVIQSLSFSIVALLENADKIDNPPHKKNPVYVYRHQHSHNPPQGEKGE